MLALNPAPPRAAAKIQIDQALEILQYLFSNDLDVPVGHIVHTGMLNEGGGYENDCSIARLSKRR